jgi:DNA uptake protein ComE-like DNA-binding protein
VDLAAAGIGIASLVLDALNQHRGGKGKKELRAQEDAPAAGMGEPRADQERLGSGQEPVRPLRQPGTDQAAANGDHHPPGRLAQALGSTDFGSPGIGRAIRTVDAALATAQALIDLNTASPDLLRSLRRINKKRAKRIRSHRPFGHVKDLKKVVPKRVYKAVSTHVTV